LLYLVLFPAAPRQQKLWILRGPRRAVQIVIYGHARETPTVRWSFRHTPPATPGAKPERADEPELPL